MAIALKTLQLYIIPKCVLLINHYPSVKTPKTITFVTLIVHFCIPEQQAMSLYSGYLLRKAERAFSPLCKIVKCEPIWARCRFVCLLYWKHILFPAQLATSAQPHAADMRYSTHVPASLRPAHLKLPKLRLLHTWLSRELSIIAIMRGIKQ